MPHENGLRPSNRSPSAIHRVLFVATALLGLSATVAAQTFGVPCINYNYVTFGGGSFPPPLVASCPAPIAPPAARPSRKAIIYY